MWIYKIILYIYSLLKLSLLRLRKALVYNLKGLEKAIETDLVAENFTEIVKISETVSSLIYTVNKAGCFVIKIDKASFLSPSKDLQNEMIANASLNNKHILTYLGAFKHYGLKIPYADCGTLWDFIDSSTSATLICPVFSRH